jgi:hypothetical protein
MPNIFQVFVEQVLQPALRPGDVVISITCRAQNARTEAAIVSA